MVYQSVYIQCLALTRDQMKPHDSSGWKCLEADSAVRLGAVKQPCGCLGSKDSTCSPTAHLQHFIPLQVRPAEQPDHLAHGHMSMLGRGTDTDMLHINLHKLMEAMHLCPLSPMLSYHVHDHQGLSADHHLEWFLWKTWKRNCELGPWSKFQHVSILYNVPIR